MDISHYKGLALSLTLVIVMSGANWQLASCKKFRIGKNSNCLTDHPNLPNKFVLQKTKITFFCCWKWNSINVIILF